jgi:hypothetical protein
LRRPARGEFTPGDYAISLFHRIRDGAIKVGQAGVGGVTYFNGPIVNETTSGGVDNPVTFGDNVRIDGRVYRGSTQGPGDGKPFIIDDDVEVTGKLSGVVSDPGCGVGDQLYWSGLSWQCTTPASYGSGSSKYFQIRRTSAGTALSLDNYSDVPAYLELDTVGPGDSPGSCGVDNFGAMVVDPYFGGTLYVCVVGGWAAFTP